MKTLKNKILTILFMCVAVLSIGLLSGCVGAGKNNYLNETVKLHKQYQIVIKSVSVVDEITIKETENAEGTTTKSEEGVKYLAVDIKMTKANSDKESYTLETDSFKLKDHTGLAVTKVFKKDLNKIKFKTTSAIKDYTWVGTKVEKGETKEFTVYFYAPKVETKDADGNVTEVKYITPDENIMVVEADLAMIKTGVDIVLTTSPDTPEQPKTTTAKTTTEAQTTTGAPEQQNPEEPTE